MARLEDKLEELRQEQNQILGLIDARNSKRKVKCSSCNEFHKIGDLTAIQTYWYVAPHGCTEGDYWREGELQFICPETGTINRLLFNNYDVPWQERDKYDNDPQQQFKRNYKKLFREVIDAHDDSTPEEWVNNDYVDQNRKKFGLVEKRKD